MLSISVVFVPVYLLMISLSIYYLFCGGGNRKSQITYFVIPTTRLGMVLHKILQGDPNQNLLFQMAITLKIRISDPMLAKPKCVLEASIYFHFSAVCLQFSAVCLQFSKTNVGTQNTFWLYQHVVKNSYFQSYSHLK